MAGVELERDPVSLPNGARRVDSEDQEGLPDPDLALVGVSDENERFDRPLKEVAPRRLVTRLIAGSKRRSHAQSSAVPNNTAAHPLVQRRAMTQTAQLMVNQLSGINSGTSSNHLGPSRLVYEYGPNGTPQPVPISSLDRLTT